MAEALRLANKGVYTTQPNPRVGCVLVRGGQIVGRGWHKKAGTGHAEVNALAEAGGLAQGSTAYVTLEPCSHFGRTPPCAKALIDAQVSEVVAAMLDPNPEVSGRGFKLLEDAGIKVRYGLMEAEARALNQGFIKRMETGLPYLRIKMATSVDGRTAMESGESQWITGPAARSDVQRLRARSSAIISGIGTILHDDAALTVRASELGLDPEWSREIEKIQPLRVILDRQARLPKTARLLEQETPILWCVSEASELSQEAQEVSQLGFVDVLRLSSASSSNDAHSELQEVMSKLAELQCNEVLLEAGALLAGSIIEQGLWDELLVYMAPKLLGSKARPLAELGLDKMSESIDLDLKDLRLVGQDIRMIYMPAEVSGSR
ncbi:riboflavin biosynthesis protein RibD [Oleiphilus sp. HI0085]|jgi:diaminohydroxyphosphoribosylaminopyrimidine deaminase/5-amino-6-(5-phosphoribosylamino)uracil reductase|nr:riboflavin biosynthesis protein RibD [Oleiphilus sp. HI0085]